LRLINRHNGLSYLWFDVFQSELAEKRAVTKLTSDFRCFERFSFVQKAETVGFVLLVSHGFNDYAVFVKFFHKRKESVFSDADFFTQKLVRNFPHFVFLCLTGFIGFRMLVSLFRYYFVGNGQSHFPADFFGGT
jgi:hypothetical protein